MYKRSVLLLRYQAVRSPPVSVFSTIVARNVSRVACHFRVRVLVRLSHPRHPDRNQDGCTVGVLPDPPVCSRCPSSMALVSYCVVVRHPRRRVDCLAHTSCYVSSRILTMKIHEDTPAVSSLRNLFDEHGYSYEWINGRKPYPRKNVIRVKCKTENFVPIVFPGLSMSPQA